MTPPLLLPPVRYLEIFPVVAADTGRIIGIPA
jgi:hypothetical protein